MNSLPALDGLRGLAVTLVLLRHAAYMGGHADQLPPFLGTFMLNGWIGVDLFFVLSGFLISRPFFHGRPFAWGAYLAQRALRILPAYFFVLGLVATLPYVLTHRDFLFARLLVHVLFLQDYLGSDLLVVLWSLGVEEKFYLLAPLLLPAVLRLRDPRHQCAVLLAIVLLGPLSRAMTLALAGAPEGYLQFFRLYRSPFHACVDALAFGMLLARLETIRPRACTPHRAQAAFRVAATLLAGAMLSHVFLDYIGAIALTLRATMIGLLCSMLVGAAIFQGAPRLLEAPVLRWLGRISYSLYLIHLLLLPPAIALARASGGGFAPFFVGYVVLSLAAAHVMYVVVESPFNTLRRRLKDAADVAARARALGETTLR